MALSKSLLNDLSHALDLLESENARLLDDNARLQEIVTDDELRMRKVLEENAKLRNEVDNLLDFEHLTSVAVAYAGCDECGEYKQTMLRLFAENAKLRELITAQCECVKHDDCSECVHYSEGKCTFPFKVMHRELGLEVDG